MRVHLGITGSGLDMGQKHEKESPINIDKDMGVRPTQLTDMFL